MKVLILGSGSTALVVASILKNDRNYQIVGFIDKDENKKGKKILGIEIIGNYSVHKELYKQGVRGAVVAIGSDNKLREKYYHELKGIGFEMINVIHKSANIDSSSIITEGVVVGAGSIISPMVSIERNTILEEGVIIGANTNIADNVYVGVGSCISGGSFIKRNAFLSAGCSVSPFVTIGKNAFVKPGQAISKNVPDRIRGKIL